MLVLHVVEATIAGVRTHLQSLLPGLEHYGVQSIVACPLLRQDAFGDEQFIATLKRQGIPFVPVAMRRDISPAHDLVALLRLHALIQHGSFDVVHLHSSKAGLLGRVAATVAGCRQIVYSPHGMFFLGDHTPLKRRLFLAAEQVGGLLCQRMIATSPSEYDLIVRHRIAPAERVVCIEYGIETNPLPATYDRAATRAALGLPPEAPAIGTAARVAPQKNPLLFVEAAARVLQNLPEARFLWCGDGELRTTAEQRAVALGIAERCRFLGHREDAAQVLAALDLFWLTSNYESFGMATAEAMALERPVVATDVLGTRDVVAPGVTGLLVPPRDPQALAAATIELLRNPERARAFGRAGRQRVLERYTIDRMARSTARLYEELAARSRPLPADSQMPS